jgi:hypothetical protein
MFTFINKGWLSVAIAIVAFFAGYHYKDVKCERDFTNLQASMQEEVNKAQEQSHVITGKLQEIQHVADKNATTGEDLVNSKYDSLVSGLHKQDSSTVNRDKTSLSTTTREATSACSCRQYAESKRAYATLQKSVLDITRKCDIQAVRYNELVQLYEKSRELLEGK